MREPDLASERGCDVVPRYRIERRGDLGLAAGGARAHHGDDCLDVGAAVLVAAQVGDQEGGVCRDRRGLGQPSWASEALLAPCRLDSRDE